MPRNLLKIIFILVRHYQCEVKIIRGQSWFVALYVLNLTLICAQEKTHEFPFNHCTTGQVCIAKSDFGKPLRIQTLLGNGFSPMHCNIVQNMKLTCTVTFEHVLCLCHIRCPKALDLSQTPFLDPYIIQPICILTCLN